LTFNGTNSLVVIPSSASLNVTTAMTLEAWVYPTAAQSGWRTIMQKEADAYFLNASTDAGPLQSGGGSTLGGTAWIVRAPVANPVNNWTHVALTYTGTSLTLYLNGAAVITQNASGPIQTTTNPLSIGGNVPYGEFFLGLIDDVRVYSRALTPGEILTDMATPIGGIPGGDVVVPSAPSTATATALSSSQVNVSWGAATDNVGVTGYRVERCTGAACTTFSEIATISGQTYGDTGRAAGTIYRYQLRATDAAGNFGPYSAIAETSTASAGSVSPPIFVGEVSSATDGAGAEFNQSHLALNINGTDTLLILAWHSEFDGGLPDSWTVTANGVPGTLITEQNGYNGGAGNRRFRIYYWLNPAPGPSDIVVSNPYAGPNELSVSTVLLSNVRQVGPLGAVVVDVATQNRTSESETVASAAGDVIVHVIADALVVRGVLGNGETSRSVANDGLRPADGDASLWISTKVGQASSTTVSSSGWASRVLNGVAIVVHGK
jgi:hypothetical protein